MKDTITDIQLLLIRACKRDRSLNKIKKIVGKQYALHPEHVGNGTIIHALLEIVLDYNLIRSMNEFLIDDLNPKKDFWLTKKVPEYHDNLIQVLISKIACSEVSKFPRYRSPAWFKNKFDGELV